jgi:hypothetical protein
MFTSTSLYALVNCLGDNFISNYNPHAFKCIQGVRLLIAKHGLQVPVEDMALIIPISLSI